MFKFANISLVRFKTYIFFAFFFIVIYALGIKNDYIDYDLWARLINGQYVFKNLFPLMNDFYSFAPTHTWVDPEWLLSGFIYFITANFGISGLILFKCITFFVFFSILIFSIKLSGFKNSPINYIYFLAFVFICVQVGYLAYSCRCQIITFIFFIFWLFCLEKARNLNDKYLYFLPILMLIWQNLHGGCIAGFGTLLIYIIGQFLNKKPLKKFILIFALCVILLVLNPWGVKYYSFLFYSSYVDRSYIYEWNSIFKYLNLFSNVYFYFVSFAIFSYIFQNFKKKNKFCNLDKTKLLMILLLSYLSIFHLKHIMLALIGFSMLIYDDIVDTFELILLKIKNIFKISEFNFAKIRNIFVVLLCLLVFIYSVLIISAYSIKDAYKKQIKQLFPIVALEFLKENNIKGKMVAPFEFGSFIAYKYYPDLKIFIDGRQEQVYYFETIKEFLSFVGLKGIYSKLLIEKYKPDVILFKNTNATIENFKTNTDYFLLYSDNYFCMFALNKFKKNKNEYKIPDKNIDLYLENIFKTNINFEKKDVRNENINHYSNL